MNPFLIAMTRISQSRCWLFLALPLLVTVGSVFAGCSVAFLPAWLCFSFGGVFLLGSLFFLLSAITWFVKGNTKFGLAALGCFVLSVLALAPALLFALFNGMMAEDMDDFADDLVLPEGIELFEPGGHTAHPEELLGVEPDSFQRALKASLETPGTSDASILPSIPALGELQRDHPNLLRQYLTVSPAWWVHVHKGKEFATRRWRNDGRWEANLHGHFSSFFPSGSQRYQVRTCLGLSGKAWHWNAKEVTAGVKITLPLSQAGSLQESYIFWDEGGIVVEMLEQAETQERRMTKAAIQKLQAEFASLLEDPTWEHARALLPEGAIARGKPSFSLTGGAGIYTAVIRSNPGEPGRLYLKAYEISKEIPLSKNRLKKRTSEFVGWSNNPQELFRSSFQFTIYEGDWGQYFGARFEVWFSPEDGGDDRKLMESNWKIEGWTR